MRTFTDMMSNSNIGDGDEPEMPSRKADEADKALGLRIRQIRNKRGISQDALASAIGKTFQCVQRYESGQTRVSFSVLVRIMSALNVTPDQIFADIAPGRPLDAILKLSPIEAAFSLLPKGQQSAVLALVRTMAQANADDDK